METVRGKRLSLSEETEQPKGWRIKIEETTVLLTIRKKKDESSIESRCSIFRVRWKKDPLYGGVAQLGEHLPCKQGVKSSNLFISTRLREAKDERAEAET